MHEEALTKKQIAAFFIQKNKPKHPWQTFCPSWMLMIRSPPNYKYMI
jgi:hypothetical protein